MIRLFIIFSFIIYYSQIFIVNASEVIEIKGVKQDSIPILIQIEDSELSKKEKKFLFTIQKKIVDLLQEDKIFKFPRIEYDILEKSRRSLFSEDEAYKEFCQEINCYAILKLNVKDNPFNSKKVIEY